MGLGRMGTDQIFENFGKYKQRIHGSSQEWELNQEKNYD